MAEKRIKGKKDRNNGRVSARCDCLLNHLPRDIWVRMASMVASSLIQDLFNMMATCTVFLDAARSSAVYKVASMSEFPIVSFFYYVDRPEKRFLYRCVDTGNPAAMFQSGMMDFLWIDRYVGGIESLTEAAMAGNVGARYMCAMLLMCHRNEDGDRVRRGLELYETVRVSKAIDSCRKVFKQVFAHPWLEVKPSDPGQPVVCRSRSCPIRGTMENAGDISRVSCVRCLADFELFQFLKLFKFR